MFNKLDKYDNSLQKSTITDTEIAIEKLEKQGIKLTPQQIAYIRELNGDKLPIENGIIQPEFNNVNSMIEYLKTFQTIQINE